MIRFLNMRKEVESFPKKTKGRSAFLKAIDSTMDFITMHKVEESLINLLLNERTKEYQLIITNSTQKDKK